MTTKTELAATVSNINYLRGVKEGQPGWLILAYYSMGKPCQLEMVIEDGPLAVRIEPKTARMSIKEAGSFLAGAEFGIKVLSGSSLSLVESAGREPANAEDATEKLLRKVVLHAQIDIDRGKRMTATWHRVIAHARTANGKNSRVVLLAKFRMRIDADVWAERLRKDNPTWIVEVRS